MLGTQEVRAATNEAQRISQEGDRMVSTAKAAKGSDTENLTLWPLRPLL